MRLQYNGVSLAGTGANVAISATTLHAMDAIISATAAATVVGANGVIMANLVAGQLFYLPGAGRNPAGDEDRLDLSQYSVNTAGGQTVNVAYSVPR